MERVLSRWNALCPDPNTPFTIASIHLSFPGCLCQYNKFSGRIMPRASRDRAATMASSHPKSRSPDDYKHCHQGASESRTPALPGPSTGLSSSCPSLVLQGVTAGRLPNLPSVTHRSSVGTKPCLQRPVRKEGAVCKVRCTQPRTHILAPPTPSEALSMGLVMKI